MKFVIALLVLLSCQGTLTAQRVCGTVIPLRSLEVSGTRSTDEISRDTLSNEIINIPVVVHILYQAAGQNITDAQVLSQLNVLNQDYQLKNLDAANIPAAFKSIAADVRINFCLARVDPNGRSTQGIIHKYTSKEYFLDEGMKYSAQGGDDAWDSKKYLNIWVCYLFGRSLGFASLPGGPADKDGVVINYDVFGTMGTRAPFNKGRTATHEIGHWLGLKHLWGDEACGTDDVDDTPSQRFSNYYCPTFPHVTSCSPNGNGDMFMNYMDFTDDACMSMFSQGQKIKMRSLFGTNGSKNSFLNSVACNSSLVGEGPLPSDTIPVIKVTTSDEIKVFPNPVTDILNITANNIGTLQGKTAILFTTTGKIMVQQILQSSQSKINLGFMPAGIYFLKIGEGKNSNIFKIIKR